MAPIALLEVDFQGWIVDLAGDTGAVDRAVEVRRFWREHGAHVFCLRYLEAGGGDRADPTSPSASFLPGLEPTPADLVLSKSTRNAFDNPDLDTNLRLRGVEQVVVDGLLTDHGVALTALSALDLGYQVTVAASGCASTTASAHQQALKRLAAAGARIA